MSIFESINSISDKKLWLPCGDLLAIEYDGKKTTDEIIGSWKNITANPSVNNKNFPMREEVIGKTFIRFIRPDSDDFTQNDISIKARRMGLRTPLYEYSILLADKFDKYPEFFWKCPVPSLHIPWIAGVRGNPDVIVLSDQRLSFGHWQRETKKNGNNKRGWHEDCLFVFAAEKFR